MILVFFVNNRVWRFSGFCEYSGVADEVANKLEMVNKKMVLTD